MGKSLKWKSRLVSSSLPLEFEAAKILVSKRFAISADFAYARNDSGVVKDFSVDLHATGFPPFLNPNEILATIELLVECKQRHPNISWLFFPDPNQPDFSPITLGCTLHAEDEFSRLFFAPNATVSFDKNIRFCYKGTEIDEANGNVYDSELKHGIAQLQYALPRLYTESVLFNAHNHPENNHPFLFCSILLTTANLFVAHRGLTTADVENSSSLKDIAAQVPYLIFFSDYGPDFVAHCRKECAPLVELPKMDSIRSIEDYRRKNGEHVHLLPSVLATSLSEVQRYELISHFSHFVVCTMRHFPSLINRVKRITTRAVRDLEPSSKRLFKKLGYKAPMKDSRPTLIRLRSVKRKSDPDRK
jgi:hypothetical protein